LGVLLRLVSGVRERLRPGLAAWLLGCGLAFAAVPTALAQSTWGGTANTSDYNDNNNWTPAAAPIAGGQSAVFDTTGSNTVTVTAGPIAPDRWTFNSTSQSFSISGADVNFSPGVGIVSAANANQFISIANNIGGAGVQVWVAGNNTLQLSGTNTYSGGTQITSGTVQVTNINSVGTGAVLLNGGTFKTNGAANLTFTNNFSGTSSGSILDVNGSELTYQVDILDQYRKLDVGATAGLSYKLMKGLGMNFTLRYYYGLADITKYGNQSSQFNRSLYIVVGIPIGRGKALANEKGQN